ncbi:MAG: hypothetical protein FWD19_01240 [Defluviitaleaceae bacterium]|nr:hypothetical protein [Defluviitaleaceae bacterium]
MSFEIFADSCFDLPEKTAQEFNVIPYIFTLDGKDYFDFRDYRELPIKNLRRAACGKNRDYHANHSAPFSRSVEPVFARRKKYFAHDAFFAPQQNF